MKKKAVLFDIDGVMADTPHWEDHFPGEEFDSDRWAVLAKGNQKRIDLGFNLLHSFPSSYEKIFLTGRCESFQTETRRFLDDNLSYAPYRLLMRSKNNDSTDVLFKLKKTYYLLFNYQIEIAVDDRASICEMYQKEYDLNTIMVVNKYSFER
jgi:hypothetical protein